MFQTQQGVIHINKFLAKLELQLYKYNHTVEVFSFNERERELPTTVV